MAVKTKDYTVNYSDFSSEGKEINGKGKTAIRIDSATTIDPKTLTYTITDGKLIISDGTNSIKISNYTGIKYIKTDYAKSGKKETYNLYNLITENAINNTADILYNKKKKAYVGTNYNDSFASTTNAETFTGGLGKNTFNYSKSAGGKDIINLTNKENLVLNLTDINKDEITLKYANKNKDLVLYIDDNNQITLKNFAKKNVVGTGSITLKTQDNTTGILLKDEYIKQTITTASNYTGTRLNDYIDARLATEKLNKKGKHVDLVFKGGAGNDIIESSNYADKITGGKGINKIIYSSLDQLKGDKIYLTKSENLSIDVSGITTNPDNVTYTVSGKNLVVEVINGGDKETFTIMNFGTKDVTTSSGAVKVIYGSGENDFIDLRTAVISSAKGTWHNDYIDRSDYKLYTDKKKTIVQTNTAKKGLTINGGAGTDTIIGTNYSDTIKAGTGTGDNITGGTGNDKLYASTTKGSTTTFNFSLGDGKDTIYSGKGSDTIKFDSTVNPSDIKIEKSGKRNLVIRYGFDETGKAVDTITIKNYYDKKGKKITTSIKNIDFNGLMFNLETLKSANIVSGFDKNINGTDYNDLVIVAPVANQEIKAGKGDDIIYTPDTTDNNIQLTSVYVGEGNDTVYAGNIRGTYYLDSGDNTVYVGERRTGGGGRYFQSRAGSDTFYTSSSSQGQQDQYQFTGLVSQGGHDTLVWSGTYYSSRDYIFLSSTNYNDIMFTRSANNNDLVLRYGENDDLTFKDFYSDTTGNYAKSFKIYFKDKLYINMEDVLNDKGVKYLASGLKGSEYDDYIFGTDDKTETIYGYAGNDLIDPKGGNDTIYLGADDDILLAGDGNKIVYADSGNNEINLGSGTNQVYVGVGSDTINHSTGSDTIIFEYDTLSDLMVDLREGTPVISRKSDTNTVTINGLTDYTSGVTIKSGNETSNLFNLNTIIGSSTLTTSQNLTTGNGKDTVYTGLGNDSIEVGSGTNTIYLTLAESQNSNTYTYADGTDTFILPETIEDFTKFTMQKSGNNLIVAYNTDEDILNNVLIISDFYSKEDMKNNISFTAGNTTKTLAQLITDNGIGISVEGTENKDNLGTAGSNSKQIVYGFGGDDTITTGNKNDYINGGSGNDNMQGGSGDDNYEIDSADWGVDKDIIYDSAGSNDTLKINANIETIKPYFELSLNKDGSDNVIMDGANATYTTGDDLYLNSGNGFTYENIDSYAGVKITNYFKEGKIENISAIVGSGNDYINISDLNVINITAQTVANWLYKNNYGSVSEVLALSNTEENNAIKNALVNLFKPIVSGSNITGTNNSDLIIPAAIATQEIKAGKGDDIIYTPDTTDDNIRLDVSVGQGNDTVYAGNIRGSYYLDSGDNTVYVGERRTGGGGRYFQSREGNNTFYTSSSSQGQQDQYQFTGLVSQGGHDTLVWSGTYYSSRDYLFFTSQKYNKNDAIFTRTEGSNDLVLRYDADNDLTFKDYYLDSTGKYAKSFKLYFGDELYINMEDVLGAKGVKNYLTADSGTITGTDNADYIKALSTNELILNGGKGDDYYNVSFDNNRTITDTEGDDILLLDAKKANVSIMFNVKQDGTFADGDDKLILTSGGKEVVINDFDSIETIRTSDGLSLTATKLDELQSAVAGWLGSDGRDYADVSAALESSDKNALITFIANKAGWQS